MKFGKLAAVGAAAAALLMAGNANALTFVATASNTSGSSQLSGNTKLIVSTIGTNEFTFSVLNATDTWTGATSLGAFAFNGNIVGTVGTLTAKETFPGSGTGGELDGGLNSGGCNGSGFGTNGFCFGFSGATVASEMDFDIKTTGTFSFSSSNVPDLKVQFLDGTAFDGNGAGLFSADIPFCSDSCPTTRGGGGGVPEPATWAMMLVGAGMVGGAMRMRRKAAMVAI
jgi:hypothetical protein